MFKFTLVPSEFFEESSVADYLSSVSPVEETDLVKSIELPQYKAVLVYCGDDGRALELQEEARALFWLTEHNKVLVNVSDTGTLDVLIAFGKKLQIINTYRADVASTALFYVISAMERFKFKPGLTVLTIFGKDAIGLAGRAARIFKRVEVVE